MASEFRKDRYTLKMQLTSVHFGIFYLDRSPSGKHLNFSILFLQAQGQKILQKANKWKDTMLNKVLKDIQKGDFYAQILLQWLKSSLYTIRSYS